MRIERRLAHLLAALVLSSVGCATGPIPNDRKTDFDVVVVGAGMSGLSAGAHLTAAGLKVLILEQHHKVGGCTSSFSRGPFNFDVSLQEMAGGGPGTPLGDLLQAAGIADDVELIRIPELYRTIAPGLDITLPGTVEGTIQALCERWPAEREGIERFYALMAQVHDELIELRDVYRAGPVSAFFTRILIPFRQPGLLRTYRSTLQELLDEYFVDVGLKTVVSQLWFYYGPPPSRLWAPIFLMGTYSYLSDGAWQIRGSSQALADAYARRVTRGGGEVRTGTRVSAIRVEDERVRGVTTEDGETIDSRYVISTADPYQTFFKLIGEDKSPPEVISKIREMRPSNSFVGLYLGLDVEPSFWGISDYEVFLNTSLDADAMHSEMLSGNYETSCASLTFYTNLNDPFYAPPGKSVLVVHAYSKTESWPLDKTQYQAEKQRVAEELIDLAETLLPGLREHIEVRESITPVTIEAFTLQRGGVPYGFEFTPDQWQRLPNATSIDGLYLAGSWTQPSHGVAGVQISGHRAARLILDREDK